MCHKLGEIGYGRKAGEVPECAEHEEYDAGLCYNKCGPEMKAIGPVCWGKCPKDLTECGALCLEKTTSCGEEILKDAGHVFDAVKSISEFKPVGATNALANIVTDFSYPVCNDPESAKIADAIRAVADKTEKISGIIGKFA